VDGERKTITALFADLKGSTALIEGLDPEEARALIDPALHLMMDAVHRYEGYVAQALGDGVFALFGAPLAHEDHPQRALYAALRMQEEMRRYGDQVRLKHGVPLAMRVGVNTGEVVVRSIRKDDLHTDYVPVGHSTNLAARMEQMATPGSILITEYTKKLTEGYFELKALGAAEIKGLTEPLAVYEVLGAGPLRTRLQVSVRRGLTRFVGRQRELEQLQQALDQAKAGHGQIVGVMGEPGLGKSRLFYEFVGAHGRAPLLVLQAYSVSHGKASPYLPVIELLKSYFRIEPPDDERTRREKVTGKVLTLDRSLEDTLPYLFALLGIEEQPSPLQQMDPQIRRKRTFEALKKLFLRESLNQPLILIFEDLHWIDGETQGFLGTLSESVASARILLLTNYRPEYRHEWGQKTYYTQLRLAPFGKAEAEEFLNILMGEHGFPLPGGERDRERVSDPSFHALKQLILEKTEGTPFFMEEIVQDLKEQGVLTVGTHGRAPLPTELHLPPTVQGVLAARIDRLTPDEKALLQQLAVLGREFPLSLVKQVIVQPEDDLYRLLSALQHKEFLYEQPAFPESEYVFKHALTQEVAYNSVLIERRKTLHEQTGQAIEQLYHDRLEEHYNELAHHYSRSGNTEKAIEYLQKAGQQAVQRSVHTEAINHFAAALELLKTLPATSETVQQELSLQIALGVPVTATKGFAASEVERIYTRAQELCQHLGETPELFAVLQGLWLFSIARLKLQAAQQLGEQLLRLGESVQEPLLLIEACHALGATYLVKGEPSHARQYFERGMTLYNPQQHHSLIARYGYDSGVANSSYLPWALWFLGYPDQALAKSREAVALARELSHPFTLALALSFITRTALFCRDEQMVQELGGVTVALCAQEGFTFYLGMGTMLQGWALIVQANVEAGIAQIRQTLMTHRNAGAGFSEPFYLGLLAEGYGKMNQPQEGLSLLTEAFATVQESTGNLWESELYRLKGELTLQSRVQRLGSRVKKSGKTKVKSEKWKVPNTQPLTPSTQAEVEQEAEECFLKALDIARQQQAKSLELRAAMSLVRLRQQQALEQGAGSTEQGARTTDHAIRNTQHVTRTALDEARTMLSEIYNWFTEGFDTLDLKEAKALIEGLDH
jgi:class 3 adenylate cyclase/predicted ATPase